MEILLWSYKFKKIINEKKFSLVIIYIYKWINDKVFFVVFFENQESTIPAV